MTIIRFSTDIQLYKKFVNAYSNDSDPGNSPLLYKE